jgi:hypothetical protein
MAGHGDDVKVIGLSAQFLSSLETVENLDGLVGVGVMRSANGDQSLLGRRAASHRS